MALIKKTANDANLIINEASWNEVNELKKSIEEYIYYYNNKRIKLKNKGLPPILYRQQSLNILSL